MQGFEYPYEDHIDVNDDLTPEDLADGLDELQAQEDELYDFGTLLQETLDEMVREGLIEQLPVQPSRRTYLDYEPGDYVALTAVELEDDETGSTVEFSGLVRLVEHHNWWLDETEPANHFESGWFVELVSDGWQRGAMIEALNIEDRAGRKPNFYLTDSDFMREVDPHSYGLGLS